MPRVSMLVGVGWETNSSSNDPESALWIKLCWLTPQQRCQKETGIYYYSHFVLQNWSDQKRKAVCKHGALLTEESVHCLCPER